MKSKLFVSLFTSAVVTGICLNLAPLRVKTEVQAQSSSETEFICKEGYDPETKERVPTTYAWLPHKKIPIIRWTSTLGSKEEWTPQKRCDEVSSRFDKAYRNNTIGLITNSKIDNERVICTAKNTRGACDTLLLTLREEDNPLEVLERFNLLLNGYEFAPPVNQNSDSQEPQKYIQIDIENFLRNTEGEPVQ